MNLSAVWWVVCSLFSSQVCKTKFSPEKTCACDPESELPGYLSPNVTVTFDLVVSFIDGTGSFTSKVGPELAADLVTITVSTSSPSLGSFPAHAHFHILAPWWWWMGHGVPFMQADEFLILGLEDRTKLKTDKLFERFKVFFKVDWTEAKESRIPRITILECQQHQQQLRKK